MKDAGLAILICLLVLPFCLAYNYGVSNGRSAAVSNSDSNPRPVRLYNSVTGMEIGVHKRAGDLVRKLTEDSPPKNNPGNLRDKSGNFRSFKTKKEGYRALVSDLKIKVSGNSPMMKVKIGKNYRPTIKNILKVYAPPSENDTRHYVKFVSGKSKIAPDKPLRLSDVRKIVPHIVAMEKGREEAALYEQFLTE